MTEHVRPAGGSIFVTRSLLLSTIFVASLELALAPSASAQFRPNMWGSSRANSLDIQKQRSAQMGRLQKYSAPVKPRAAPRPPALNLGTPGPYGRVDLAGRPTPGYASVRDHDSPIFGPPRPPKSTRANSNVYAPRALTSPRAIPPVSPRAIPPAPRIPSVVGGPPPAASRIPPPPPIP